MAGRHGRSRARQSRAARLAACAAAVLILAVVALAGVQLAGAGHHAAPPRPSPGPVGVVIPALARHRVVRITVNVWAGETIIVFPATPRPRT